MKDKVELKYWKRKWELDDDLIYKKAGINQAGFVSGKICGNLLHVHGFVVSTLYEQAMIAAMQSLIEKLPHKISTDMSELENVTSNAIWFAGNLVRKLKDKEF